MAQPSRLGMTDVQKSEIWQRWRSGEPITDISRALGSIQTSVTCVLRPHGGFAPPLRKRSPTVKSPATAADNATAPLRRTRWHGRALDARKSTA